MVSETEQNILKEKSFAEVIDELTLQNYKLTAMDCYNKGYQLAQKENQSQQSISQGVKTSEGSLPTEGATHQAHNLEKRQQPSFADTQLQKYKKETAEKVEKLKDIMKRTYFRCYDNIDEIINKVFKEKT